ncbi:MAG: biopolymer transporter ExbD [bacterium]|jgi:biopolymer transport protein ExbD|nr:biopolymer transporter ExbD [bacterium]
MNFLQRYQDDEPTIPMAPMIDIIFLLLIFFITTSVFARLENELSITVPTAEMSETPKRTLGELVINIKMDGSIVVNQKTISLDQLQLLLTRIARQYPDQSIIIRGDRLTAFENTIKVLDLCAKCKVWNVSFAALPPEGEAAETPN